MLIFFYQKGTASHLPVGTVFLVKRLFLYWCDNCGNLHNNDITRGGW